MRIILFWLVVTSMVSCYNVYENAVVGDYVLINSDGIDSTDSLLDLKLTLAKDQSFNLKSNEYEISGTWEADDDGDRTWIRFYFNNVTTDGVISGNNLNLIRIWNSKKFGVSDSRQIVFVKIK